MLFVLTTISPHRRTCFHSFFFFRSSTDSKDRSEKPFALAFLRLKENEGTAVKDGTHDLMVYKVIPPLYNNILKSADDPGRCNKFPPMTFFISKG